MESTVPGKTKCVYVEDTAPDLLTKQINKYLDKYIVIDIKYIQNFNKYGAYILYLAYESLEFHVEEKNYEVEEPNTYGLN